MEPGHQQVQMMWMVMRQLQMSLENWLTWKSITFRSISRQESARANSVIWFVANLIAPGFPAVCHRAKGPIWVTNGLSSFAQLADALREEMHFTPRILSAIRTRLNAWRKSCELAANFSCWPATAKPYAIRLRRAANAIAVA